ncbi:WcbI family polysaccharide biosynthesis putative acetyltransferase [Agreia sp.]|uniref:WcbI family polysaccharide biosynthesis putative acetyltransferase n=1 Tax=Agreia sp. TaxID=1872416 RepID=UPI0035BC197B
METVDDSGAEVRQEFDGRTLHYGEFYEQPPSRPNTDASAGIAVVMGNCQAESLRIMLHGAGLHTVRVPPVHELTAADIPFLQRLLVRATLLVSQPVRDDYHGLPVGLRQLSSRLVAGARAIAFPVIRFAGLYPAHAIIRPPSDLSLTPPIVAYHDLRTVAEASGVDSSARAITPRMVRAIAADSIGELARREEKFDTVRVSDLFASPGFDQLRTLNHPGNVVFAAVAERVRHRAGLAEHMVDAGRPLLDGVHAPRLAAVIDAYELDDVPGSDWIVGGAFVPDAVVREAHLDWYAEHPDAVEAGLARHRRALHILADS